MIKAEKNSPTIRLNYASNGVGFATRYPISLGKVISTFTTQSLSPTLTQLLGGILSHTSVTGAGVLTTPTGTLLSGIDPAVGDSFQTLYANVGADTVTVTGGTGVTVVGTAAVAAGINALLTFVNTGTNTWNVYVIVSA